MSQTNDVRNQEIGGRVEAERRAKSIPIDVLARKVGISPRTLFRWEHGMSAIPVVTLERLATELGITIGDLLAEEVAS